MDRQPNPHRITKVITKVQRSDVGWKVYQHLSQISQNDANAVYGYIATVIEDLSDPKGTRSELGRVQEVIEQLVARDGLDKFLKSGILPFVVKKYHFDAVVTPIRGELKFKKSRPVDDPQSSKGRASKPWIRKDDNGEEIQYERFLWKIRLPQELADAISKSLIETLHGHRVTSRKSTAREWKMQVYQPGTPDAEIIRLRQALQSHNSQAKRIHNQHEITEVMVWACAIETANEKDTPDANMEDPRTIRKGFFKQLFVFDDWLDFRNFLLNSRERAKLVNKVRVLVPSPAPTDWRAIRTHFVGTLDSLARDRGVDKLIFKIINYDRTRVGQFSQRPRQVLAVFLRRAPANKETEDVYNFVHIDYEELIEDFKRPPPDGGFKRDAVDERVADRDHFAETMAKYREVEVSKGVNRLQIWPLNPNADENIDYFELDMDWQQEGHPYQQEALRIMQTPRHTPNETLVPLVITHAFNISMHPYSETDLRTSHHARYGGSRHGAEHASYTSRFSPAAKRDGWYPTISALHETELEARAVARLTAMIGQRVDNAQRAVEALLEMEAERKASGYYE